ncbi:hypothetical protein JX266_007858 [Neoarthrinium moseri]|nr:hypothetical protein JX266_007858 [Neoarthrinium moseri]
MQIPLRPLTAVAAAVATAAGAVLPTDGQPRDATLPHVFDVCPGLPSGWSCVNPWTGIHCQSGRLRLTKHCPPGQCCAQSGGAMSCSVEECWRGDDITTRAAATETNGGAGRQWRQQQPRAVGTQRDDLNATFTTWAASTTDTTTGLASWGERFTAVAETTVPPTTTRKTGATATRAEWEPECSISVIRCKANTVQACNGRHQWEDLEVCVPGTRCETRYNTGQCV